MAGDGVSVREEALLAFIAGGGDLGIAAGLAALCGLQREEIFTLTWQQLDIAAGVVRLSERTAVLPEPLRTCLARQAREEGYVLADPPVTHRKEVLALLEQGAGRMAAAQLWNCGEKAAARRLEQMERAGFARRSGAKWYLPRAVTHTDEQRRAVEVFLRAHGFAYRAELARELGLPPRAAGQVLRRLKREGAVTLEGQVYRLNTKKSNINYD